MRVLFYLPVVTPWWFDNIVVPIARALSQVATIDMLVPSPWQNTGLDAAQRDAAGLDGVTWHILDDDAHPALRTDGSNYPGLIGLVERLAPDICLCRSADLVTPARFPGTVRYIMEATIPLFATDLTRVQFATGLFDHGFAPPVDTAALDPAVEIAWNRVMAEFPQRTGAALADGRTLIALPLEYEHPEMFFRGGTPIGDNVALIDWLAARLPDDVLLAATNHPLNERYCDNSALHAAIARHADRIVLVPGDAADGRATAMLARRSDGVIVGDSKSIFLPAIFGTPILRLSPHPTAGWMNAYFDFDAFIADVRGGTARAAAPGDAKRWIARQLTAVSFDAADPHLDADELLARIDPDPQSIAA